MRTRLTGATAALLFALLLNAACSTGGAPTTAPTQILIPSVPTATFEPLPATPTLPSLPAPADFAPTQIIVTPLPADLQAMLLLVTDDLARDLRVDVNEINVALVEAAAWVNDNLGCDGRIATDDDHTIAGFRVILVFTGTLYEYHTGSNNAYLRCDQINPTAAATFTVGALLAIDPVAAELSLLAQRRVADELDLPLRRIDVVDMRLIRWTDSSLGCPQSDQAYTTVEIDGYRIVVSAADNFYIFHSDSERLILCAPDDEQLP